MLLDLIRFLRGYVVFDVSGRFPERFINITSRKSIRVWNAARCGEVITAAMYMSDYRRIRPLARAAGVRLKARQKRGLPTYVFRFRDRVGLVVGGFVFILTVFVMSQFIWSVEITGLETVSESEMRSLLSAHGLYVGAFKPGLNYQDISRSVMLDNGRVGWMAVNVTGSYASVEIKEEAPAPELPDARQPANVKARRDGTILRIETGEGVCLLKEGSGVAAGQLVVSGVIENKLGGARLVRADASVIAATAYAVEFSVPERVEVMLPNGEKGERRVLDLFGLRFPLSGYAPDAVDSAVTDRFDSLEVLDTALPVGVVTESVCGMEKKQIIYNDNSAEELLTKQAQLYEAFTLKDCTVTDRHYRFDHSGGVYTLGVTYDCVEDIAVQTPIGVEKGEG